MTRFGFLLFLSLAATAAAQEPGAQASTTTEKTVRSIQAQSVSAAETYVGTNDTEVSEKQKREIKSEASAETTKRESSGEPSTKPTTAQTTSAKSVSPTPATAKAITETKAATQPEPISEPRLRPKKPPFQTGPSLVSNGAIAPVPVLEFHTTQKTKDKRDYEPNELLLLSTSMKAAIEQANQLSHYGLQLGSREKLEQLSLVVTRFRLPAHLDSRQAQRLISKQHPQLILDTNQRYQLQTSSRQVWGQQMVKWPHTSGGCATQSTIKLGMLDTAVNSDHPALLNSQLIVQNFIEGKPATAAHGTAVASLLIGNEQSGFNGLLTNAELYAANVFRRRGEQSETTSHALLMAIEWLLSKHVSVINMSLGGNANRVLEQAIQNTLNRGITVVAAAGNQGPSSPPVYPAAQAGVVAVTAVDANGRVYKQANNGDYIDFAAPGVNIWAANRANGGQYQTGTSFATPFVTALLAVEKQHSTTNAALKRLRSEAVDKGATGKDAVYGWGIVQATAKCQH